jgi:hypothetical protein
MDSAVRTRRVLFFVVLVAPGAPVEVCAQVHEEWAARFATRFGGINAVGGRAVGVNFAGEVLVAGTSYSDETGNDMVLLKYDPSGAIQWEKRHPGPHPERLSHESVSSLVVDVHGDIYVAGPATSGEGGSGYLTAKYSLAGDELWTRFVPGAGADLDLDLAVDDDGSVVVAGSEALVRYAPDGRELWTKRTRVIDASFSATDAAVDREHNVLVCGLVALPETLDLALAKLDPDGNKAWLVTRDGLDELRGDRAYAVAVDSSGNAVVTGRSLDREDRENFLTLKCDPGGRVLWERRYEGRGWGAEPVALALDGADNIAVGGTEVEASGSGIDFVVLKYDPQGTLLWRRSVGLPGGGQEDALFALQSDAEGNTYFCGRSAAPGRQWDYSTAMLDASGLLVWMRHYDGPQQLGDQALSIALGPDGAVIVTGASASRVEDAFTDDFLTLKYSPVERHLRVPGDCNDDAQLDISDAICVFGVLFLGTPPSIPCGGELDGAGNVALVDWQPDARIDIADGIALLAHLFAGAPPHPLARPVPEGRACVAILGCGPSPACR